MVQEPPRTVEAEVRTPPEDRRALYQAAGQHWAHSEQIRWTLLYNYLMASTILLLAWAAVFAAGSTAAARKTMLVLLAIAGVVISALWFGLAARANSFVQAYAKLSLELENIISCGEITGPFRLRDTHKPEGLGNWVQTWFVLRAVPLIFALLYTVLVWISVYRT